MKKVLLPLVLAAVVFGGGARRPSKIIAIGDSITAARPSYVHKLGQALGVPVEAYGYPGRGAEYIRSQVGAALAQRPSHLLILAGVNDLASGRAGAAEHVRAMVDAARAARVVPIVVGVTPWRGYRMWRAGRAGLNAALSRLGAAYVPTDVLGDADGRLPAALTGDGVHLTEAGHQRLAQVIARTMGWG